MEIDIFALCDGAYNYNGKLTLVGTYDQIVLNSVPQSFRSSLAVKIKFLPEDISEDSVLTVCYLDKQDTLIGDYKINIPKPPADAQHLSAALAINKDLNLSDVGVLKIQLVLNKKILREKTIPISINNTAKEAEKKA